MKHCFSLALLLSFSSLFAQTDLYDLNTVQVIKLTFNQTNWDYQMDTAKSGSEGYLMAATCEVNGVVYDSVGVKYKGNSSYNANNAKNPLHISLNEYISGQNYQGYKDIKLANGFSDPSFVREALSYDILSHYMHCPKANFARVYINGTYVGLYTNDQSIDKKFDDDHFYSSNGVRVKCTPVGGAGPGGGNNLPDLVYYGTDSASYNSRYEIQSDFGWKDLIDLCDTLNNNTTAIEEILDVDRALWMLSFNTLTVNLDSYTGTFKQNYYLYRDQNNRFSPIVWDLNMCFGGFSMLGGSGGMTQLDSAGKRNLTIAPHLTDANWPLISKLLANSTYKKMYVAHMKTMAEEMFTTNYFYTKGLAMQAIADSSYNADPNKFYTYAKFLQNMVQQVTGGGGGGPGGGSVPGIKNLMDGRVTYLNTTTEFQQVAPVISAYSYLPAAPVYQDAVTINATISNSTSVYLGYRYNTAARFAHATMYDDGAHGDGAAADGVFGATIPASSLQIEYYIYAQNANAGVFSPARAEYEFHTITVGVNQIAAGAVTINEFVADNINGVTDAAGEHEDWIELYNNTNQPVNLVGLYLSDDATNKTKWQFPETATIPANGYLIVWADEDAGQSGYHANFQLSSLGEELILSYGDGAVLESYTFGSQLSDVSEARCPNGTGNFTASVQPSYDALNGCTTALSDVADYSLNVYPNPASSVLNLQADIPLTSLSVTNLLGETVFSADNLAVSNYTLPLNRFEDGVYVLNINKQLSRRFVVSH